MRAFMAAVYRSRLLQAAFTLVIYAFYACILGASLAPSAFLVRWARSGLLPPAGATASSTGSIFLLCLSIGAGFFLFLYSSLIAIGLTIRVFSRAVKPGKHDLASPTGLAWVVVNGIHTIAFRMILPLVTTTFFATTYFRLCGCRLGRGVWLTTVQLLDPYLISIGEDTVVGGDAVLTAHVFENGTLFIAPIKIGRGCMIGAHALLSPGVTVGDGATIGMRAYIRAGKRIPAGARISSLAGLPRERVMELERDLAGKKERKTV